MKLGEHAFQAEWTPNTSLGGRGMLGFFECQQGEQCGGGVCQETRSKGQTIFSLLAIESFGMYSGKTQRTFDGISRFRANVPLINKYLLNWGTWVAQSVKPPTLDFGGSRSHGLWV